MSKIKDTIKHIVDSIGFSIAQNENDPDKTLIRGGVVLSVWRESESGSFEIEEPSKQDVTKAILQSLYGPVLDQLNKAHLQAQEGKSLEAAQTIESIIKELSI